MFEIKPRLALTIDTDSAEFNACLEYKVLSDYNMLKLYTTFTESFISDVENGLLKYVGKKANV